MHPKML